MRGCNTSNLKEIHAIGQAIIDMPQMDRRPYGRRWLDPGRISISHSQEELKVLSCYLLEGIHRQEKSSG